MFVLKFDKAEMAVRGSWYCSTETVLEPLHAGANPLESIWKILSFLNIMNPNFLIKINLGDF